MIIMNTTEVPEFDDKL
jgi:hypothetical protein